MSNERKFRLQVTEDELLALIQFHGANISNTAKPSIDTSERLHDLVKRLNKETPDIEPSQATAAKEEAPSSW